jgi:hypothetical protein
MRDNVTIREIEVANKLASYKISWLLKSLGFNYPCLNAFNTRMESLESNGLFYYINTYGSEINRPTYGLIIHFLKNKYDIYEDCYHGDGKFDKWEKNLENLLIELKRDCDINKICK